MKFSGPSLKKHCLKVLIACFLVFGLFIALDTVYGKTKQQENDVQRRFRMAVEEWFPEEAAEIVSSYGLHYENSGDPFAGKEAPKTIVLIHGLDDPGKVWMNLSPALITEGYHVWTMTYPNDQRIAESAKFFNDQLIILRQLGIKQVDIVAHSMGGLVAREMLTNPDLGYDGQVRSGDLPLVEQLIMVATPNHGSHLARFRFLAEIREQIVRITQGKWHWLDGIMDGTGEATTDLIPGSRFLTDLNNRPHPPNVALFIIAGAIADPDQKEINDFLEVLKSNWPGEKQELIEELEEWLKNASRQLGDGLVSVESALLPGVPHKILPGTHFSIIRNVLEESERVPPAIPIIQKILSEKPDENLSFPTICQAFPTDKFID